MLKNQKIFSTNVRFSQSIFSNALLEDIKERIISQIPTKDVIITETSKKFFERLENNKKEKKETREDIEYHDQPIRRNNITLRKPEIKYRKEERVETPEIIHRSVMEYPDSDE